MVNLVYCRPKIKVETVHLVAQFVLTDQASHHVEQSKRAAYFPRLYTYTHTHIHTFIYMHTFMYMYEYTCRNSQTGLVFSKAEGQPKRYYLNTHIGNIGRPHPKNSKRASFFSRLRVNRNVHGMYTECQYLNTPKRPCFFQVSLSLSLSVSHFLSLSLCLSLSLSVPLSLSLLIGIHCR